jgi:hypothetical protein
MLTRRGHVKTRARASESSVELPAVSVRCLDRATGEECSGQCTGCRFHAVGNPIKVMTFVKWTEPTAGKQVSPGGSPLESCRACGGRRYQTSVVELQDGCE